MVSSNQVFQSAVSHCAIYQSGTVADLEEWDLDETTESTKTKSAGAWSWVEKANIGMRGAGDEFHGLMQLDEWLNCRK